MNAPDHLTTRQFVLDDLLARPTAAAHDPNRPLLAQLLASRCVGMSCLPRTLGLPEADFAALLDKYFPGFAERYQHSAAPEDNWTDIPEREDLQGLLSHYRAREFVSEALMVDIVSAACAGPDHLWQDLGLFSRNDLSRLMWINFPELARHNTGDMKWKKFIYRQLCAREGIYVCPAPSCGECADYAKCFAPEV